tara:strand:+ start:1219 stop:1845 length:627 start_codon:yes stop_codon:yes gene_type:complete
MARKNKEATAQDDTREKKQKELFGFPEDHQRDGTHDAFYKMPIDFKTKHFNKGCTTKRRYRKDPFAHTVLVVSDYDTPNSLTGAHWVVFPKALSEWRSEQERKLQLDNGTIPCYSEVERIREGLGEKASGYETILRKLTNQVHRNDPAIPKKFFDTDGEYTSIQRRKTKVHHSDYMFRTPTGVNLAEFLREKIEWYLTTREGTNGSEE